MSKSVKWRKRPRNKDYPAAQDYLSLIVGPERAEDLVRRLRAAPLRQLPARDILRASRTPMSEVRAFDWVRQNKDIKNGRPFAPLLLVCDRRGGKLIVADGFHRLCAAFAQDQNAKVRFKLA
ncbi:MAG TPA: hypothetical protein VJ752_08655 [Burkholderiaceae bacterium]|nr:hypothetical protein [Burkholderiaceae bacterium]